MINSELLKEAIADAKAVRATALANAKAALEEAFAPRFEAMFAEKLKEESEEQEEMVAEVEAPNQISGKGGEAKGPKNKPVSKGTPKQPSGPDNGFKPVKAGKGPADVGNSTKKVNETAEEEEEGKDMDENYEQEQEESKDESVSPTPSVNEFGLTSEDLDSIIKELEAEVAGEEEGHKEPSAEFPAAPAPAPEGDPAANQFGDAEQGAEHGDEEGAPVDVSAEPGADVNIDVGPEAGAEEVPAAPAPEGEPVGATPPSAHPHAAPAEDDENINLEELLAALNEESEEDEDDKNMDESENHGLPKTDQQSKASVKGYPKNGPDASKKQLQGKNHNISGKGEIGSGPVGGKPTSEAVQIKQALSEAYKTIEYLRGQINEVNLLNSKLYYTNRLLKEFAEVLDDAQRLKIVENFDLTKTVRETKLAYALLAESLSFGAQIMRTRAAKSVVRPTITTKASVKQITEGLASKPVASTKPTQLITENVNEMALRFKKLAGIKESPKSSEKK